jgi:aspartate kinase
MSTKSIIVNKFGGGILKKDLIPLIPKRLQEQTRKGSQPIAVVSAMPGVTDELLNFMSSLKDSYSKDKVDAFIQNIKEKHWNIIDIIGINKESIDIAKKEIENSLNTLRNDLNTNKKIDNSLEDKIVSYGERLSAIIVSFYLKNTIKDVSVLLAEDIPIITDNNFKNAHIDYEISKKNILDKINKIKGVIVISGFTGKTQKGEITTLGRGGTDTTACFIGGALNALKVILWKDVGGVLSTDPRIIKKAKTIPFVDYFEAEEAGKIIHDKAIKYIKINDTKVEICSLLNPTQKTIIGKSVKNTHGAKLVSVKKDLNFVVITDENLKLNDMMILVSKTFEKYKLEITLISNSKYSLQILSDNKNGNLKKACIEIQKIVEKIEIVGATMIFAIGLFDAKDVSSFNDVIIKSDSDLLISAFYYEDCRRIEAIINTKDINKVVKAIYKKFIK